MRSARGILLSILCVVAVTACTSNAFKEMSPEEAAKYQAYIPANSRSLVQGTGVLTCTTPEEGIVYLLDNLNMVRTTETETHRIVASGLLPQGAEVIFDPQASRIHLKGKEGIQLTNIDPTHHYELRIVPGKK